MISSLAQTARTDRFGMLPWLGLIAAQMLPPWRPTSPAKRRPWQPHRQSRRTRRPLRRPPWLKAPANGGMVLEQLVGDRHRLSSWYAAGPSRPGRASTPLRGLTLARRASAPQASAGRWTAAGDHAPIVERSIANQQHPHHHHQADPWILPRQPAPRDTAGAKSQADRTLEGVIVRCVLWLAPPGQGAAHLQPCCQDSAPAERRWRASTGS